MDLDLIKAIGKCCVTDEPLSTSKFITAVQLNKIAKWRYPVWGNVLYNIPSIHAIAFIHDNAVDDNGALKGAVKYAIECTDDDMIIYHPIDELEDAAVQ